MRIQNILLSGVLLVTSTILTQASHAHCQIPCGIYNDYARVQSMIEDAATVDKSIKLIAELSGKSDAQSQNQVVRWVMNKEKHAQNIISTITDYFLTQRVRVSQKDYSKRLQNHHAVIVAAMEAKQHADIKYAESLMNSIIHLLPYYPENKN